MSFIDTFPGSSLDARWTATVAGAGAITVSGNSVFLNHNLSTDSAAISIQVDLSKSQQWWISMSRTTTAALMTISLQDSVAAPPADSTGNVNARRRIWASHATNGNTVSLEYNDNSVVRQFWDPAGPSWTTTTTGANSYVVDDFYVVVFEIDRAAGANRWRMALIHTSDTVQNVNSGNVLVTMTDWVNFSATQAITNNLWLVLGKLYNAAVAGAETVEYVRYADDALQYMWANQKDVAGSYSMQSYRSLDGRVGLSVDRTSGVITGDVKDPWVLDVGSGTYHMWYHDQVSGTITHATATALAGPWTEVDDALTPPANHAFNFPAVVYTPWDIHTYQMLYNDYDQIATDGVIAYAWATAPGGPWTVVGTVIPKGTSGDADDRFPTGPVPIHRGGQWEVWYTGVKVSDTGQRSGMRATGSVLTSLTKDGSGARLTPIDSTEALTADLTTNAATVSSTTGFQQWQHVYLKNNDSNGALFNGTRIRSISGGTINLSHKVVGYTTALSAKILGTGAGNVQIRAIKAVGSTWWVYLTTFNIARYEAAGYNVSQEECSLLIVPSVDLTTMALSMLSQLDSPTMYRAQFGNAGGSVENLSILNAVTNQSGNNPPSGRTVIISG